MERNKKRGKSEKPLSCVPSEEGGTSPDELDQLIKMRDTVFEKIRSGQSIVSPDAAERMAEEGWQRDAEQIELREELREEEGDSEHYLRT
ncbi:MAG TPA: hypothetical protein VN437_02620 [Rectinemataceae bacterium]|nr:hypothetical protein [Rectinemataceae bacterium]